MFKLRSVVKQNFAWTRVSAYPFIVKQTAHPDRLFIYVFNITYRYLIEVERQYLDNLEPAYGGVNNRHAGYDRILTNDGAARLLLYYCISVWTYHVYMH